MIAFDDSICRGDSGKGGVIDMLGGGIPTIPQGGWGFKNFHILPDVYNDLIKELENQISLTKGMELAVETPKRSHKSKRGNHRKHETD